MNSKNLLDEYLKLINDKDLDSIEQESLEVLKSREEWNLRDAAHSWTAAVIYVLMRKGMLRSIEALKEEK